MKKDLNIRETDFTYPNPPADIPTGQSATGPSPLMTQAMGAFGLPWPRKPLGGKPGKSSGAKGKPGPKTSRSGVHRLNRAHPRIY